MAKPTGKGASKNAPKKEAPKKEAPKKTNGGTAGTSTGSGNWFKKGQEAIEHKKSIDKANKLKREKQVRRVWMPVGGEGDMIFLDDPEFGIAEHSFRDPGGSKIPLFASCRKELSNCPPCDDGKKTTWTVYCSVIDMRSYTNHEGKEVKNQKALFPAKGSAINRLDELRKENGGTLKGIRFHVSRPGDKDPNCGRDFTFVKRYKLEDVAKKLGQPDLIKPFDYMKVLAPPTDDELKAFGYGGISGSADDLGDADLGEGEVVGSAADLDDDIL